MFLDFQRIVQIQRNNNFLSFFHSSLTSFQKEFVTHLKPQEYQYLFNQGLPSNINNLFYHHRKLYILYMKACFHFNYKITFQKLSLDFFISKSSQM